MLYQEKFKAKIAERFFKTPLHSSSFASDVLKLVGGTIFVQVLTVLAYPLLTRFYSPETFGIAALFTSMTSIIGVVVCLRYEMAIMLPKRNEEAANLLGLCLIIATSISILLVPIIWVGQEPVLRLLNAPELAPYLWLIPPAVFLSGVFLALNYWNSRSKRFGRLSIARINASISTTGTQIGAGVAGYPTSGSLIGASIIGSAVSSLVLGGQIYRDDSRIFRESINPADMCLELKRYRKFPLINMLSALLNSISWQLPIFLLTAFFSPFIAGLYSICTGVLQFPMSFIGSSISQVFFQRAVESKVEGTLSSLVENVFKVLVLLGLFPMLILALIGRDLFEVVFGSAWSEAGIYAQLLGLWTFLWFISSPLSTLYIVLEKQELGLKINIVNIITRFLAIWMGGMLGNARISIALFAISGMLVYSYLILVIFRLSEIPIIKAAKIVFSNLKLFAPAGIMIIALKALLIDPWIQVGASSIIILIYYLFILRTEPIVKTTFKR